jgi:hypothetical protein
MKKEIREEVKTEPIKYYISCFSSGKKRPQVIWKFFEKVLYKDIITPETVTTCQY